MKKNTMHNIQVDSYVSAFSAMHEAVVTANRYKSPHDLNAGLKPRINPNLADFQIF